MKVQKLGVIGAGQMGVGIAQVAAAAGISVRLQDISAEFVERGLGNLEKGLDRLVKKEKLSETGKKDLLGRIVGTTSLGDLADCDFVVEAIVEDEAIKVLEESLKTAFRLSIYSIYTLAIEDRLRQFKPSAFGNIHELPFFPSTEGATGGARTARR